MQKCLRKNPQGTFKSKDQIWKEKQISTFEKVGTVLVFLLNFCVTSMIFWILKHMNHFRTKQNCLLFVKLAAARKKKPGIVL